MDIKKLLLDRKLFLISLGVFFVGVVVLLFCGKFNSSDKQLKAEDILAVPITRPKVEFPLVFNVVDTDFNDNEKEVLQSCADNWQYETKGNFIMVIDDYLESFSEQKFRAIVMHEIGHQLALEHIKPEYPALMNLNLNMYNSQITKYDLIVLRSIYNSSK